MAKPNTEPALTVGGVTAAATAVLALVVAFLPDALSEDQQVAILGVVAVLAPAIVAVVSRHFVTPNATVVERVEGAGAVIAGPANERVPERTHVRDLDGIREVARRDLPEEPPEH